MKFFDHWKMAIWVLWTLVYAPALGVASIVIYRQQATSANPTLVGFDPANPLKATGPGTLRLRLVCNRPLAGLKIFVAASQQPDSAREGIDFVTPSMPLTLDFSKDEAYLELKVLDAKRNEDRPLRLTLSSEGSIAIDPANSTWVGTLPRQADPVLGAVKVSFAESRVEVVEGSKSNKAILKFSPSITKPITVAYQIGAGPHLALIVDNVGETSIPLPIDIPDDQVHQGDRDLRVSLLGNTPGVELGDLSTTTIVVHDDERTPVIRVKELNSKVSANSGKPFSFRVVVDPLSSVAVSVRCRVTSGTKGLVEPPDRITVAAGQPDKVVILAPRLGSDAMAGASVELTFDDPKAGTLAPSPSSLKLVVEEVKQKGNLLVAVIQTDEFVENRANDRYLWSVFKPERDSLVRDGILLINKEAEAVVWRLVDRDPPRKQNNPFGKVDSLDSILNAVFDEVVRLKPKMENPDFQVIILWQTWDRVDSYKLDPKAIRWPGGNRVHLYVLGCPDYDETVYKLFKEKNGWARFLRNTKDFEGLSIHSKNDLTNPNTK